MHHRLICILTYGVNCIRALNEQLSILPKAQLTFILRLCLIHNVTYIMEFTTDDDDDDQLSD